MENVLSGSDGMFPADSSRMDTLHTFVLGFTVEIVRCAMEPARRQEMDKAFDLENGN